MTSAEGISYSAPRTAPLGDRLVEHRQQLIPLADRAGALGGDQVAEELADDGDPLDADPVDGRLGVARERAADAADVVVGLAGEQAGLAIALLPQPGGGEGQQRQRAALALDLGEHLVDQLVVLEAVAALGGRLDEGAAKGPPARAGRARSARRRSARALRRSLAADQEVVAHAEQHVDVGLEDESVQEIGETVAARRRRSG